MADLLSDDEIAAQLPDDWERDGDGSRERTSSTPTSTGVGFGGAAGGLAQEAFHHPEMTIGWREVEVRLTTHEGGITGNDVVDLAERFDEIYE